MTEVADRVYQIPLFPRSGINAYLVDGVMVDAGICSSGSRILNAVKGHEVHAHVLTHAHPDHQGSSAELCDTLDIPLWCGAADRRAAETGAVTESYPNPSRLIPWLQRRYWAGPGYPVSRTLTEGELFGEFRVIETPGHSPGHIALWRERDRVLIAGDVLVNMNLLTTVPGVGEPPGIFTGNADENRRSIKKLADLRPRLVCVGHGPPITETDALFNLADSLRPH